MDHLLDLRGRAGEYQQELKKLKYGKQPKIEELPGRSLEATHKAFPGEKVGLLVAAIRCPWDKCAAEFPINMFFCRSMAKKFHVRCPKCRERILTILDVCRSHSSTTFDYREVQALMKKDSAAYERKMRFLLAHYAEQDKADLLAGKVKTKARTSTVVPSEKGRDITFKSQIQTTAEAIEDMKVVANPSSKHNPMLHGTLEDVADLVGGMGGARGLAATKKK